MSIIQTIIAKLIEYSRDFVLRHNFSEISIESIYTREYYFCITITRDNQILFKYLDFDLVEILSLEHLLKQMEQLDDRNETKDNLRTKKQFLANKV